MSSLLNRDIDIPKEWIHLKNCGGKKVGFNQISCFVYMKGEPIIVYQETEGAYTIHKGPGNTSDSPQQGDWREGVRASDGKWVLEYYDGSSWQLVESHDIPS